MKAEPSASPEPAIVLSIGTTHPWNVAGVGLDLLIGAELGMRVFTAVAAVSAQDATGVRLLHAIPPAAFRAQLDVLPWASADAVRIGALATAPNVEAVAEAVRAHPEIPAVVDPVFTASRSGSLTDPAARVALRERVVILPNVLLTPNLAEAAELLGRGPIVAATEMEDAAQALRGLGALAILLKGGHLAGEPIDVLASAAGIERFAGSRIAREMRGTGCTLAMALACQLARGAPLVEAVRLGRAFVRERLARGIRTGSD